MGLLALREKRSPKAFKDSGYGTYLDETPGSSPPWIKRLSPNISD
jgi:hypothetical protein